jgi:hypothetical protein
MRRYGRPSSERHGGRGIGCMSTASKPDANPRGDVSAGVGPLGSVVLRPIRQRFTSSQAESSRLDGRPAQVPEGCSVAAARHPELWVILTLALGSDTCAITSRWMPQ